MEPVQEQPRLQVKNLKAGYGNVVILEDIAMEVAAGEVRIILGGSGSGKSTLLKNILGLEKPMHGSVHICGIEADWEDEDRKARIMGNIGMLFQSSGLISSLTVGENVALPLRILRPELPAKIIQQMVLEKLARVDMEKAYSKLPGELSGGMKKRAGLARAIVTDPALLFCDEPSAGLDPLTSRELDALLLELKNALGITLVVVTHELDSIHRIADTITFLHKGEVIFDGPLTEAKKNGPKRVMDFLNRNEGEKSSSRSEIAFHLED